MMLPTHSRVVGAIVALLEAVTMPKSIVVTRKRTS